MGAPQISVVLATYNRAALLARTLPLLLAQHALSYEVVVADDGSTDGTPAVLQDLAARFAALRLVAGPHLGQAAALNAGIEAAKGDVVVFLDDDILCPPSLLATHAAAHAGHHRQAVFGPVMVAPESPRTLARRLVEQQDAAAARRLLCSPPAWPGDMRVAANTSVRRCELQAAGGFNPALTRGFDAELGLRLHRAGVSFVFEPAAAAQQLYTKSTRDLLLHDAPAYGRTEVQLTRMQGSYRARSPLALLAEGSAAKRATRRLAAEAGRFPVPERGPSAAARSAYSAAFLAGAAREAGGWGALRAEFGVRLPVLLYHHVGPARHDIPAGLTIAPAEFERQLTWLEAHGHTPIRVADWLAWRDRAAPLPPRPVLLTFDDGYADLAEHAFPTLERRRWPATVFVVTGHTVNEWDGWRAPLLGPEELREWSGRGIGIGGHSRSHADLTRLGPEALTHEIAGCARDLRALGIDPVAFAYPFGRTNAAVHAAVAADFPLAFTTAEGMNGLWTDAATQHRTPVLARHPLNDFAARVRLGWSPRERLVGGLAGVMRRAR